MAAGGWNLNQGQMMQGFMLPPQQSPMAFPSGMPPMQFSAPSLGGQLPMGPGMPGMQGLGGFPAGGVGIGIGAAPGGFGGIPPAPPGLAPLGGWQQGGSSPSMSPPGIAPGAGLQQPGLLPPMQQFSSAAVPPFGSQTVGVALPPTSAASTSAAAAAAAAFQQSIVARGGRVEVGLQIPPLEAFGDSMSSSAPAERLAVPPPDKQKEKPKKCHLHMKPNKTCKTCKAVLQAEKAAAEEAAKEAEASERQFSSSSYKQEFNCSPMLKDQILKSSYFKSLLQISTVEALAEEIQSFADTADIYQIGSATVPSPFFCAVFRLHTMDHADDELQMICDYMESAYVRCVAFLFVRFVIKPDQLWDMLGEYILDEMDLGPAKMKGGPSTVGEYVESLLMKEKYYGTPLPRIPVKVKNNLEERVAPLPQFRKRTQANRKLMRLFGKAGTPVEICLEDGQWAKGQVIEIASELPSRPKLLIRLEDSREEATAHLGKIILREPGVDKGPEPDDDRKRGRSRSRSRGRRHEKEPDLSRHKGTDDGTLLKELRDRLREEAVCGSGKDYCKRPMGFESGLAIRREQGSQESRLIEEETYNNAPRQPRRRSTPEEDDAEQSRLTRRSDEEQDRQRSLAAIYEKYGQQVSASRRSGDVDAPDRMRLG